LRIFTRFFIIFLFFCSLIGRAYASHIMGGSVIYTYLGNYKYAIQFILYQDCQKSTTLLPTSFKYHIRGASSSTATNTVRTISQTGLETVTKANSACGSNYCTKKGWYNDTITEGTDTVGYYIWNDYSASGFGTSAFVARNTDVNLKVNASTTGIGLYAFMPPRALASSSPQIEKDMTPNVCVNRTDAFSAGFYSPDGDSLVFSFVQPYDVPAVNFNNPPSFTSIPYNSGYSPMTPFGSAYQPSMDSSTGLIITKFPNTQGNYVAVVQVQEYQVNKLTHKANYIGLVRVDLEFVGVSCSSRPPPTFVADAAGYKRTVQINQPLCFSVKATDQKFAGTYDTMTITATSPTFGTDNPNFPKPYASFTTTDAPVADSGTYCWTPTCADITYSTPHTVTFQVTDQSCGVATETYSIYVAPRPFSPPPIMRAINILGSQYIKLNWDTAKLDTNFLQYNIYRRKVSLHAPVYTLVKSFTNHAINTWTDSTAYDAEDTAYWYYIVSENKCQAEGFSSDTFESVAAMPIYNTYGGVTLNWSPINFSIKDSFAIFVDVGAGLKQIALIKANSYLLPYCYNTLKAVQVIGYSKFSPLPDQGNILTNLLVVDTIPPVKEPIVYASAISWGEIDVLYDKSSSQDINHYYIYRGVNGSTPVRYDSVFTFPTGNTLLYVDKKVTTNTNYYCYYIVAVDNCGNKTSYNQHCTMLAKVIPQQRALKITWNPYVGFTPDSVKVQQYVNGKWINRAVKKATDSVFLDTGITCLKRYYRIRDLYNVTKAVSLSDSVFGTPIDTVPPQSPPNTLMTFDPKVINKIDMTWTTVYGTNDVAGYKLYSWINDTLQTMPTSLSSASYPSSVSFNATPVGNKKFCYDYVAFDSCGNSSLLHKYCTIQLIGKPGNLTANLTWSPNGQTGYLKYYIQDSTLGASGWATLDSGVKGDTADTDLGLHCNINYYLRVMATLSGGGKSYSNTVEVTPYDTIKPQQVNIEQVTDLNNSSVQLTFDKVADPVVTKYLVYYRKDNGAFTLLSTITKPISSPINVTQTGINTATDSFSYEVFAVDSCAANTSATTQVDAPVFLKVDSGQYLASLNWTKYKGFTVGSYTIQYYAGGWKTLKTVASTVNLYIDQPIPCIPKTYRIIVNPTSGALSSVSDSITVKPYDRDTPPAPVLVSASVTGYHSILVSWQKSTATDVNKYYLYRKKSTASTLTLYKALGNVTSYVDNVNTDSGISYCYAVQAVDSCEGNKSLLSSTECVVNLKADSSTCNQKIYISWTPYTGWPAGVASYSLYRHVQSTGADTLIKANITPATLSYIDSTMSNTRSYCYKIVALENPGGAVISTSNYDCSKIYQPLAPQIYSASKTTTSKTNGTIVIKWNSVAGQRYYKYYQLYYKLSTAATYTLLQNNIPVTKDSFVQTGLNTQNLDYDYYLLVVDSCGNKTPISTVHQTMTLTITVGQLIHHLSWTPYKGFNIKGYIVQRFQSGAFVNIDTVPGTKTSDVEFPAPCNFNLFYRISAIDSFGHFAWSDTVGKKAIDTIPSNAPTFVNATVINSKQVQLNFFGADSPSTYAYSIHRQTNGVWSTVGQVLFSTKHAPVQYIDNVSTLTDKHCYTIITLDSCLNATPSDTFCTITLTGTPLEAADQINWTPFKGYKLNNYQVETYNNGSWGVLSTLPVKDTALLHDSLHCYLPQYYRIIATEASGGQNRVTYSDSMVLTPFDTIHPPAPVLKYASVQPNGSIKLLWNYNTRSNIKFFSIWRSVNGGAFDSLTTLTFDTTYIDNHVNAHDTIRYYVKSIDSCKATLVSGPSDTIHLMALSLVSGFCKGANQVSWTPYQTLPGGTNSYTIFKSTYGGPFVVLASVNSSTLTYMDTLVTPNIKYTYKILATGSKTNLVSYSDTFSIRNLQYQLADTGRTIFTTVLSTDLKTGSILLQWNKDPTSDYSAVGYRLYEANPANNIYHLIFQTTNLSDTTYTNTNINTVNQAHEYKLAVYNKCNNDGPAGQILVPVIGQAFAIGNLTIKLLWNGYGGVPVTQYNVYRSISKGIPQLVAVNAPGDTIYVDSNVHCSHHYTYTVKTVLSNGLVSSSDTTGATAIDSVPPPSSKLYVLSVDTTLQSGGKISMQFSGNGKSTRSGFNIYRQVNNGPFSLYYQLPSKLQDTVYWQDQFANTVDDSYGYYIAATDSCGNQAAPIDTDRSVHLTAEAHSQYFKLNWTPYLGFNDWIYNVERRTPTTPWQKIAGLSNSSLSYIDSNVTCHIFYQYRIKYVGSNTPLFGFSNFAGDTAFDTVAPKINRIQYATVLTTSKTKGKIKLAWSPSPTENVLGYFVYRSVDNYVWTQVGNMMQGYSFIDSNLNTYQQPYHYKVTPIDSCGNIGEGFSPENETMVLQAQIGDQRVGLKWNPYVGWKVKTYNIIRDGIPLATVADTITSFTDTLTTCLRYYRYVIKAVADSSVTLISYSNTDSAKPYDNIPPAKIYVRSASIDVPAGQVVVSWDSSTAFDLKNYYVFRKRASDGQMIFLDSTTGTIYNEPLDHISGADCYYVFARDSCGNQSDGSNRACLIILEGMSQKAYNSLTWNGYFDWPDGIDKYNVYKDEDNRGWVPINTTPGNVTNFDDHSLTDDVVDYCYQVEAVENTGNHNATSSSTIVCLHQDPYVYVPNAFTPKTSIDINDSFGPTGMFIKNYNMTVYDRWGEVVFQTNSSGKWDGYNNGNLVPEGIYMYVINIESYNNKSLRYTGNVMVLY